jgi:hypothetical protein
MTLLYIQLCRISLRMIRRKSDWAAHGARHRVSLTPLCNCDSAEPWDLIFDRIWLRLKGMSIEKKHTQANCPTPLSHKIYGGIYRIGFGHRCAQNRRFQSRKYSRIRSHIQKGFNMCIRGLRKMFDEKKTRDRKSGSL